MKSNSTSGGVLRVSVTLIVVQGLLGGGPAFFLHGTHNNATASTDDESSEPEEPPIPVRTVYARYDQTFAMTEKLPADVRPYFEDPLERGEPGIVRRSARFRLDRHERARAVQTPEKDGPQHDVEEVIAEGKLPKLLEVVRDARRLILAWSVAVELLARYV